jgi:hypothetical protein
VRPQYGFLIQVITIFAGRRQTAAKSLRLGMHLLKLYPEPVSVHHFQY